MLVVTVTSPGLAAEVELVDRRAADNLRTMLPHALRGRGRRVRDRVELRDAASSVTLRVATREGIVATREVALELRGRAHDVQGAR